jgi:hypothetical protein
MSSIKPTHASKRANVEFILYFDADEAFVARSNPPTGGFFSLSIFNRASKQSSS